MYELLQIEKSYVKRETSYTEEVNKTNGEK